MAVPTGFFELSPLAGSLGALGASRPQGLQDAAFPIMARMRLYWGREGEPAPANVQGYPASVLYGGPAPLSWMTMLANWVRDWAASLAPPSGAIQDGSRWLVLLGPPAFLVPPEALAFPYADFRWAWQLERGPGDQYRLELAEGNPGYWQFRNLRTGSLDRPPPFGAGSEQVAGDELAGCTCPNQGGETEEMVHLPDSDEVDPRVITWLTDEEWRIHGRDLWPAWVYDEYSVGRVEQCPVGFDAEGAWLQCELMRGHEGDHTLLGGECDWAQDPARAWELERLYAEHRLRDGHLMQCGAVKSIDGMWRECSLQAGHPGQVHLNGPPRLGVAWCDPDYLSSARAEQDAVGATSPVSWYRIHYVDVITGSDAYSPWPQRMTQAQANAWVKKRTSHGTVLPVLQVFKTGTGWRTA